MGYDIYLSYTGRATYLTCPRRYELKYVRKVSVPRDPRPFMLGSILGKLYEWFYNDKVWSGPDPVSRMKKLVPLAMDMVFHHEGFDPDSDPSYVSGAREKALEVIPVIDNVIRKHRLLTEFSKSEVDLTVDCHSDTHGITVRIGGRADFIHGTGENVWVVDGKASKQREKYVDPEQLVWYGTQHYLKYHVAPSRLGFLYYLFPRDPLQWITYDSDSLRNSVKSTMEVALNIMNRKFDPRPSKACQRCDYRHDCPEGTECVSFLKASERVGKSIFDIEPVS